MINWDEVTSSMLNPNHIGFGIEAEIGRTIRDLHQQQNRTMVAFGQQRRAKKTRPPLTPAEKAQKKLQATNARRVYPSLLQRYRSLTKTFLNEDGLIVEGDKKGMPAPGGDYLPLVAVPKQEHFRRLALAYEGIWKRLEQDSLVRGSENGIAQARKRMQALEQNRYICPLSFFGGRFTEFAYFDERILFFWKRQRENKVAEVSLKEYDRRMRLFLHSLWTQEAGYRSLRQNGRHLRHNAPKEAIIQYLISPKA